MLHKRCDIKNLIDDLIRRERDIRNQYVDSTYAQDEEPFLTAVHKIEVLQELRDGIFDEYLSEDNTEALNQ